MPPEAHAPLVSRAVSRVRIGLAAAAAICAAIILRAAQAKAGDLATIGAAAFVVAVVIATAVTVRFRSRNGTGDERRPAPGLSRDSAFLAAIAYAWGAVAMQAAYLTPLTGLRWQHGWQYALAMALLALGAILVARSTIERDAAGGPPAGTGSLHRLARSLAAAQALIAGGGFAALVVSGKAASVRADWVANRVFLGLAAAIFVISVTYLAVGRRPRRD